MGTKKVTVGILAHVDAGKTTLAEAILYRTGTLRRLGRVDHQDAFLDTDAMERARGITIFSKQAKFVLGDFDAVSYTHLQGRDMHTDGVAEAVHAVVPDMLHQLLLTYRPSLMYH